MGLLNTDERQELIDLLCQLCQLPDMQYPHNRLLLVATLPADIKHNIRSGNSVRSDITSIVDTVSDGPYTEWKLSKDMYPLLVVIKNAKGIVGGGPLADKLNQQMGIFRDKFGLSPEEFSTPTSPPHEGTSVSESPEASDQFLKDLYNFIQKLPGLEIQLSSISRTFNRYLIKQKCLPMKDKLINICDPVREFAAILRQSKDSIITNNCISLKIAVSSFENKWKIAEKNIGQFCEDYGKKMEKEQPAAERRKLQEDVDNLIKCCNPVKEAAQNLYTLLSSYYIGQR